MQMYYTINNWCKMSYKNDIVEIFWKYRALKFPNDFNCFDKPYADNGRPPVFVKRTEWMNVLFNPMAERDELFKLLELIPITERHRWFGSMSSSQALAQSVLGNIKLASKLEYLNEIRDEEFNEDLFSPASTNISNFSLEHKVELLKEPRKTSLDAFICGDYQIAIECKFTEADIGNCSRPDIKETNPKYSTDYCVGSYTIQRNRKQRCTLSESGISYWKHIPILFNWKSDMDLTPCPLNHTYQLVRNILSACIKPNGIVSEDNGHALLIYDERNPAFQQSGKGFIAYMEVKKSLKNQRLLRKCSWQKILNHLRSKKELFWLTDEIKLKYGM